jgi:hypothetical protein
LNLPEPADRTLAGKKFSPSSVIHLKLGYVPGRKSAESARRTRHRPIPPVVLKKNDELVALEYLANGHNATAAYRSVHPNCSQRTAEVEGSRTLRKPEVAAFIDRQQRERFRRLQMDGDEALARIAMDARADITELFDEHGRILPPKLWPAHLSNSVEAFELKRDGSMKVRLASKTMARRTILEHTGKLKSPIEGGISALARALRGDLGLDDA